LIPSLHQFKKCFQDDLLFSRSQIMNAGNQEYHKDTLHLPRIICLHGGGTNARIFKTQCRVISRKLKPYFRLLYAEAPFNSGPGPDVVSVYADWGPFKRWFPEHGVGDRAAIEAIDNAIKTAMIEDDRSGAIGPWVGLLGFSQGAKLAASLMFRQQVRVQELGQAQARSDWKFAVLLAGRSPIVSLDPDVFRSSMLSNPSQIELSAPPELGDIMGEEHVLKLPTIHVHGLADSGLHFHRELLDNYCSLESARVLEWDGAHRVPLKSADVNPLIEEILNLAKEIGAL
jgi:pimeloyl-ACP methyl ester carboxylesterase